MMNMGVLIPASRCAPIMALALLTACGKQSPTPAISQAAPAASIAREAPPALGSDGPTIPGYAEGESADSFFDPKNYPEAVQGTIMDPQKLTATERQYGMAPKRDPRVTYQDDVILMEHGDEAVREAKSDGITFSFDAKAEHVSEFVVGKIVFATGRVVGRVGQVSSSGDVVTVKFAPVSLTEVVKKGTFMIDSTFSPKDLIIYTAPDFPSNADRPATPPAGNLEQIPGEPRYARAAFIKTQATLPSMLNRNLTTIRPPKPPTLPAPDLTLESGFGVRPAIGSDGGVGLSFKYVKNGVIFDALGQMVIPAPRINFLLQIDSSGIKTFGMEISGGIGLRMTIEAYSDVERFINVNTTRVAPIDISLPCPVAGLPLSLSFHTSFNLHTSFAAKTSTLTSSGSWTMNGTLFAGYKNGKESKQKPPVTSTSSLAGNVSGASLGINTVGGGVNVRPMIGLGGFGFMTGVYMGVTLTADIVKQASEAQIDCHGASGSASVDSGVGYQLPGPLVDFVNTILKLFTTYQMDKEGTIKRGWSGELFKINEDIPTGCAGLSGGAAKT